MNKTALLLNDKHFQKKRSKLFNTNVFVHIQCTHQRRLSSVKESVTLGSLFHGRCGPLSTFYESSSLSTKIKTEAQQHQQSQVILFINISMDIMCHRSSNRKFINKMPVRPVETSKGLLQWLFWI